MKFVLSPVDSLNPCRHLLYTMYIQQMTARIPFLDLDVSSFHSNGVSEVAAVSHARRSIEREMIHQLGHFKQL